MPQKIWIKRGNKENLPRLDVGEPALTLDTDEFFIGSLNGNISFTNKKSFDRLEGVVDNNVDKLSKIDEDLSPSSKLNKKPEWSVWTEFEQRKVNVKWFGAKGDGVTDDSAAIQSAINSINDGTIIYFPRGNYVVKKGIVIDKSCIIEGVNSNENGRTVIRSSIPDNSDDSACLLISEGIKSVYIKNMHIRHYEGKRVSGIAHLGKKYSAYNIFDNVWVVGFFHGFNINNMFMTTFKDCLAAQCVNGFNIRGFSTSLFFQRNYANNCSASGFHIGNTVYSTLMSCGSDNCLVGYNLINNRGLSIIGCGAEGNSRNAFYFVSDNNGVSLLNCFAVDNASDPNSSHATFAHVENNNYNVIIKGCVEERISPNGNRSSSIATGANVTGDISFNKMQKRIYNNGPQVAIDNQFSFGREPTHEAKKGTIVWNTGEGVDGWISRGEGNWASFTL